MLILDIHKSDNSVEGFSHEAYQIIITRSKVHLFCTKKEGFRFLVGVHWVSKSFQHRKFQPFQWKAKLSAERLYGLTNEIILKCSTDLSDEKVNLIAISFNSWYKIRLNCFYILRT